jgi:hypothetical protein
MNILHKKILTLGFGCFLSALAHSAAPDPSGNLAAYLKLAADQEPDPSGNPALPPAAADSWYVRWSPAEDALLRGLVVQHGVGDWAEIASFIPNRNAKQCMDRWRNYLNPALNISNLPWKPEEDTLLQQKLHELGPKWTQIAAFLPGRIDVNCQSRWKTIQRHHQEAQQLAPTQRLSAPPPATRAERRSWSPEEDAQLRTAVAQCGEGNWPAIASLMPSRTRHQCRERWINYLAPDINLNLWTSAEDELLRAAVAQRGARNWVAIAEGIPGRTRKQCRNRWFEYLDSDINHDPWTDEEDNQLLALEAQLGVGNWAAIAKSISGRTGPQCQGRLALLRHRQELQQPAPAQPSAAAPSSASDPAQTTATRRYAHWTQEEDAQLRAAVAQHGVGNWVAIAEGIPGRIGQQCQNRWCLLQRHQQEAQQPAPAQLLSAPPPAQFPDNPADYFKLSADQGYLSGASALPPAQQPDSISLRMQFAHLPEDDQNSAQPSAKQLVSFPSFPFYPLNQNPSDDSIE